MFLSGFGKLVRNLFEELWCITHMGFLLEINKKSLYRCYDFICFVYVEWHSIKAKKLKKT